MLFDTPNAAIIFQKLSIYENLYYILAFLATISLVSLVFTKILRMDLMRFIQNLHESNKNPLKPSPFENNEKFKEIFQQHQKENQIKLLQEKVNEMSDHKAAGENSELDLVRKYEDLIKSVMEENDKLREDRKVANIHIENLEKTIKNLLEKFKWAKDVIKGFESNEKLLKSQLEKHKEALGLVETKLSQSEQANKPISMMMSRSSSAKKYCPKFSEMHSTSKSSFKSDSTRKYNK